MEKLKSKDINVLVTLIALFILYTLIAFLCTLFSIFYALLIWGTWLLISALLFYTKTLKIGFPSKYLSILLTLSICVSATIALVSEPSVFGGRDQGSISDAAFLLQKNASIIHSSPEVTVFARIYGPGQALHFPGFHYTVRDEIFPQFPLLYISFLAGFVALFGIGGFLVANALLLCLFLVLTTSCIRILVHTKAAWWFYALLLSSFPILWFAKFTLSENLAGALFWSAICLLLFARNQAKPSIIWLSIVTIALLCFVRIEGLWLAPVLVYTMWKIPACKTFFMQNTWRNIWVPSALFAVITLTTLIMNTPFYKTILSIFLPNELKTLLTNTTPTKSFEGLEASSPFLGEFTTFLVPVYVAYGLFFPLIITALFIVYTLYSRKTHPFLILIGISAPLFLYFIDPQISADHPWMLRRFVWIIVPITLGATVLAAHLNNTKSKDTHTPLTLALSTKMVLLFLIAINLTVTSKYILFAPNKLLLEQTTEFGKNFNQNDLILLSPEITGDGWSMIDAPLRNFANLNAVYFFNPLDYPRLDTSNFTNIFLVAPSDGSIDYETLLREAEMVGTFTFDTTRLSKEMNTFDKLPAIQWSSVTNMIYKLK